MYSEFLEDWVPRFPSEQARQGAERAAQRAAQPAVRVKGTGRSFVLCVLAALCRKGV